MKVFTSILLSLLMLSTVNAFESSLKQELGGIWRYQYQNDDNEIVVAGHSVYRLDGTFSVTGFYRESQGWNQFQYSGKWELSGQTMMMEILETTDEKHFPAKSELSIEVLEVTEAYYRYKLPNGSISKEFRVR